MESALAEYGGILDYSFPNVEPNWDEDCVARLAKKICVDIILHHGGEIRAVHIMGEFTLTFALIREFKKKGYACIASTSKRIVEMLPDGSKRVAFEFCRFRHYE